MGNFIEFYGYKWFYGGSQNKLIDFVEKEGKDRRVVKMVTKNIHLWTIMTQEELLKLTKKHNSFISEVLHSYPMKLYLDIDCKEDQVGFKEFNYNDILKTLDKYLPEARYAISGSIEPTKKSFHIIIHNYIIQNYEELQMFKKFIEYISIEHHSIDTAVYSRHRIMKCIYQSKNSSRAPQNIIVDNNETHHFICSFITNKEKLFSSIELPNELTKTELNDMKIIKEYKQSPVSFIQLYSKIDNIEKFIMEYHDEPHKLLSYMPPLLDHSFTWKVFLFCFKYDISFETFWNWTSYKDNSETRLNKWKTYWDKEVSTKKHKEYYISKVGFLKLLSRFYPELVGLDKTLDVYTGHFKQTFKLSIKPTIIESITQEHLNTEHRVVIFNIGMGGGKTTNAIHYLKDKEKFYWITPRIALAANTYGSMERSGITDVIYYKDDAYQTDKEPIKKANKLIIQGESLHYLKELNSGVVVIDEIETVLNSFTATTHEDKANLKDLRKTNFTTFLNILRAATKIILIDAFTTQKTIDLISAICDNNIVIYESAYKPKERTIIHYDEKNVDFQKWLDLICDDLDNNKKLWIFYPFKNPNPKMNRISIHDIEKYLREKYPSKNIKKALTGDSDKKEKKKLTDANTHWNADVVLVNGCITVGVNHDKPLHFDKIYMAVSSFCNLPRDIIQASMRVRHVIQNEIVLYTFKHTKRNTFEINDYYESGEDTIYNKMFDEVKYEHKANWFEGIKFFCKLTNYKFPDEPQPKEKIESILANTMTDEYKTHYPYHMINAKEGEPINIDMCTFDELLRYKKYYFDIRFENISKSDREVLWNQRLEEPYNKISMPLISMINIDNNIKNIRELNWDTIKVSNGTNQYLTEHFNCVLKYPVQRIVKTLNEVIGITFVTKKMIKKNTYYSLSDMANFLLDIKEKMYTQIHTESCLIEPDL